MRESRGRHTRVEHNPTTPEQGGRMQRTRRALGIAALELFEARGVESVTAADIAAEAGVTERTFFRHFRSKEEAALLIHQRFDRALMDDLPATPDMPPQRILQDLYRNVLGDYDERDSPQAVEMLRVQALVAHSPQLRLASLRRDDERAEELVAHLLARTASQSEDDELAVRMAVEVTGAAVRVAFITWCANAGTRSLADIFDRCLHSLQHQWAPDSSSLPHQVRLQRHGRDPDHNTMSKK